MEDKILGLLKNTNTSYKYFFLLACVRSVNKETMIYDFNYLSKMMVIEYLKFDCALKNRLTKNDRLFDLVIYLLLNFPEIVYCHIDIEQYKLLCSINDEYVKKILSQLVLYVPYRLIINEQFKNDLEGVIDRKKNAIIEKKSNIYDCIYEINDKKIIWKHEYYDYILKNKDYLIDKIYEKIKLAYDKVK